MQEKGNYFWQSYVDLMTSLFAVILVLFVASYFALSKSKSEILAEKKKLEKQLYIMKVLRNYAKDYFIYDEEYQRFLLKRDVQFPINVFKIPLHEKQYAYDVGLNIENLVNIIRNKLLSEKNVKILVLVEGMASNLRGDNDYENYLLSYKRALELVNFWKQNNILTQEYVELQIAGSGIGGKGRYKTQDNSYNPSVEMKNQRFIIQLIVKADDLSIITEE